MRKRNLVIVRAGDKSLHPEWLRPVGGERSWDLVVSYFGNDPDLYRRPDVVRIDGKGPKWAGLHALLVSGQVDWQAYDRIWLPDDDLACTPEAIDRLFMLADYHELHLCQPSLSHDSYISHATTVHNPRFLLRRTNFIEVMAPLLTRELLERVLPTMIENESGWGLDFLWQMFLDRPRRDSGVIDALQIRHTRPVGGPNYAKMKEQGKSPWDEMNRLLRKYALHDRAQLCWSAVGVDGRELRLDVLDEAMPLLGGVLDGMRKWLNEAEFADIINGYLRQSATVRQAADQLKQPATA
jgi:hypothetical protein